MLAEDIRTALDAVANQAPDSAVKTFILPPAYFEASARLHGPKEETMARPQVPTIPGSPRPTDLPVPPGLPPMPPTPNRSR